ncbi:MAG: type II toxin-antitoxin system MqsA family antitoxin [Gemmobacter sp.]
MRRDEGPGGGPQTAASDFPERDVPAPVSLPRARTGRQPLTGSEPGSVLAQAPVDEPQRQAPLAACPACGGATGRREVMIALWEGETLALVRDVPAVVCLACHERYFEDDVVMRLDLLRAGGFAGQAPAGHLSVPVYGFATPPREPGR